MLGFLTVGAVIVCTAALILLGAICFFVVGTLILKINVWFTETKYRHLWYEGEDKK